MKKIFMALVLATILALPFSAFAMTTVADSDLSTVTGQAGVSINMDLNMNVNIDLAVWGDRDGITGSAYATQGYVGLSDIAISNLRLRARTPYDDFAVMSDPHNLFGSTMMTTAEITGANPFDAATGATFALNSRFLTIDVGSDALAGTKTVVRIGIPTLEITMDSFKANVGTATYTQGMAALNQSLADHSGNAYAAPTANEFATFGQQMGSIEIDGLTVLLGNEGSVDISGRAAGSGKQGIDIGLNTVTVDWMRIMTVAWGDKDGIGAGASNAGYVGLYYTIIENLVINGGISIDVATLVPAQIPGLMAAGNIQLGYMLGAYAVQAGHGLVGSTFVQIGITDGTYVHMGLLDTAVGLGSTPATVGINAIGHELGELIVAGMNLTFNNNMTTTPGSFLDVNNQWVGQTNGNYIHILAH
jgi:hypothetical protein